MSETGHPINIAHFSDLIATVETFGPRYNPANNKLSVSNLKLLLDQAKSNTQALATAATAQSTATNARKALFAPLDTLARRIESSASSAGATPEQLADIEETTRKIKGERAGAKNPVSQNPEDPKSVSVSQQSFVNLANHLSGLLTTIQSIPAYAPFEEDLRLPALQTLHNEMEAANANTKAADIAYTGAKTNRDTSLYGPGEGIVDIAALVKEYVFSSSSKGAKNPDYMAIKGIAFRKP